MNEYEKYQLQWLMEHGYSLADFVKALIPHVNEVSSIEPDANIAYCLKEGFYDFKNEGFNGDIWLSEEEWKQDLNRGNEYNLTNDGMSKVKLFIEQCKVKQESILKAGLDTAKETTLPSVEDILCNVEDMVDKNGDYTNAWSISDNYLSDPLELHKDEDFVVISNERTKDNVVQLPLEEKETPIQSHEVSTPHPHYTDESLGNWMVHPFKKVTDTEDDEYKALLSGCEIGTEATRSGIIDKAIQTGYISLTDNVYSIEDKGRYMVEFLNKSNLDLSPQRTVELQKDLKKVYNSKITVDECVQNAIAFLNQYFENACNKEMPESQFKNEPESLGCCPWCNQPVYAFKSAKGLFFTHSKEDREKCSFALYEKQKIFGAEYHFTNKKVEALLAHKLPKIDLVNKSGVPYTAGLDVLPEPHEFNGRKYPAFKTQLLNKK